MRIGVFWLLFIFWTVLAIPFSIWRGGSVQTVMGEIVPFGMAFLICALALTLRQIRILICFLAFGVVLFEVFLLKLGEMTDGRLALPQTTMENPNDLAIHLLIGMALLLVFFRARSIAAAVGIVGIAMGLLFVFRTGSRGTFLALIATAMVFFFIGSAKTKIAMVSLGLLVGVAVLISTPKETLQRLTAIVLHPEQEQSQSRELASEANRMELLIKSIEFTLEKPLFGVGPGQFPEYLTRQATSEGQHVASLRPHNAYTQISSETGIPL